MLVFVIALQSPQASRDWPRVSALCTRTLRSVCNQISDEFRVVLVCHAPPTFKFNHPRLEIVARPELPIPSAPRERMLDKWTKVRIGLCSLRPRAPFHAMIVDADDCVSNRLAGHAAAHPSASGWFFDRGFVHDEGTETLFLHRHRFDVLCGSSSIVRCDASDIPASLDEPFDRYAILRHGHSQIADHLASIGRPLARLPFPGAVYITGTGENDSNFALSRWRSGRVALRKLLWTRRLTKARRQEFGLYPLAIR